LYNQGAKWENLDIARVDLKKKICRGKSNIANFAAGKQLFTLLLISIYLQ
jgi:hypothetical protein